MPKPRSVLPANLVSQVIDEHSPGSILADFEALLGFVEGGVRSTGKYHLLPMAQLCELDERMTRPLRPRLKRPQQRSFPHLSGLYLLLRATGLGVPEGYGKTSGRLTLDPALHAQWLELNETERYFNQWVNNLKLPEPEFRDGVHYFKVSLGSPWRRIAMPAKSDMEDLAQCILDAFDFDGDHLYEFDFVASDGRSMCVAHPCVEGEELHTDEMAIGDLPLAQRRSMQFLYDFGASWKFDVQLEKVEPDNASITKPTIVESHGEAPSEYEHDDDYDDECEDEDGE